MDHIQLHEYEYGTLFGLAYKHRPISEQSLVSTLFPLLNSVLTFSIHEESSLSHYFRRSRPFLGNYAPRIY